jgi:hypothetical protein
LITAVNEMEAAYNDAVARPTSGDANLNLGGGEIGGETLTTGVYTFGGDITISGGDLTFSGSATDVFIIQTSKSVKQAASTNVVLTGGALAENIFCRCRIAFEGRPLGQDGCYIHYWF